MKASWNFTQLIWFFVTYINRNNFLGGKNDQIIVAVGFAVHEQPERKEIKENFYSEIIELSLQVTTQVGRTRKSIPPKIKRVTKWCRPPFFVLLSQNDSISLLDFSFCFLLISRKQFSVGNNNLSFHSWRLQSNRRDGGTVWNFPLVFRAVPAYQTLYITITVYRIQTVWNCVCGEGFRNTHFDHFSIFL